MARKKASFIFCDAPDCKTSIEVDEDSGFVPDGWLHVVPSSNGRYDSQHSWEFCSALCVSKWARLRDKALKGEPITRSSPTPVRESADAILDVFRLDVDEALSVTEIAELSGVERSSVNRQVNELARQGTIFQTEARRGPFPSRYRINT